MQRICFGRSKLTRTAGKPAARAAAFLLACTLACVCAVALGGQSAANPAGQSATQHGAATQTVSDAAQPAETDTADQEPSPSNFTGATYVPSGPPILEGPAGAEVAAAPPPKPVPADAGGDATRQQINNETADLLNMAYALKAEVDKTTQDTLSVSVVRKANQIEQLARKVQGEMHPTTTSSRN